MFSGKSFGDLRENYYFCSHITITLINMENYHHCYKMTWDTEGAPNPHLGVLTLAICKPRIRKYSQVGDWISGWTAKNIHGKDKRIRHFDNPQLIYLARIKEKLTFGEYWEKYPQKQPEKLDSGDNIYEPIGNGKYKLHDNKNDHGEKEMEHDLKGEFVLICDEFYYYGVDNALDVSRDIFNVIIPRWKKVLLSDSSKLIDFVRNDNHVTIKGKA
jgi:hypothetical protein